MKIKLLRKLRKKYWEKYRILQRDYGSEVRFALQERVEKIEGVAGKVKHYQGWTDVVELIDYDAVAKYARLIIADQVMAEVMTKRGVTQYAEYEGDVLELR